MGVVLKQEMNEILPGDDYLISNCSLQYSCAERLKKKKVLVVEGKGKILQ